MRQFTPLHWLDLLRGLFPVNRFLIAYSGGLDSTALLHALKKLEPELPDIEITVFHVDHSLHPESGKWSRQCEANCARLDISCRLLIVDAMPKSGESPEAAARRARYQVLSGLVKEGDCLLTAHH